MRATFVAPDLHAGGAERQWSVLVPLLAERGVDVSVVTLKDRGPFFAELDGRGIPCRCAEMTGRFDRAGLRRTARLLRDAEPDVVVTRAVNAVLVAELLKRRLGAVHVMTQHSMPQHPQTRARRLSVAAVARRIDGAVVVSGEQIAFMRSLGFRDEQLRVIANGTPEPRPTRPRDQVRTDLGFGPDECVFLLAAALRPEKRIEDFVVATVEAHRRDRRVRGLVCGGGPADDVRRLADATDGVVRFLGPRSDVADLMSAADVVTLTSVAETLPMTLLEGMALAKPLLATAVGGVTDVVVDELTGLLVPPNDPTRVAEAMLRLSADRELARRLGEAGRQRQRAHYSAERMADEYLTYLAEVARARWAGSDVVQRDGSRASR